MSFNLYLVRADMCQGNVRDFFQGQRIIREFCNVSGKNDFAKNIGNIRELYISVHEARMYGPDVSFMLN